MSYIPDYRADEKKLTEKDYEYWLGYKNAMEDARCNLGNAMENLDFASDELKDEFEMLCECSETETMCSIVESNEAYENVEFTDSNKPLYKIITHESEDTPCDSCKV